MDIDLLCALEWPLTPCGLDKRPLYKGWQEKSYTAEELFESPAVGVKLGGFAGFADIEGDGPEAEATWETLITGLDCKVATEWDSSRGRHRLVRLPQTTRDRLGLKGVIKIGDLEIRLGESDRYTCHSVIPPAAGREFIAFGDPCELPDAFWERVTAFKPEATVRTDAESNPDAPGNVFNAMGTWEEAFGESGWSVSHRIGNVTHWIRPGKTSGVSATTGHCGDKLYVFSSNADPLEHCRAYDKFGVFATLFFDGDFSAAATELARRGYVPSVDASEIFTSIESEEELDWGVEDTRGLRDLPDFPGLVTWIADMLTIKTHKPDRVAGVIAGLMVQSSLMARKYVMDDEYGTPPNLAALMTGSSGSGKTLAVSVMSDILQQAGLTEIVTSSVKSGAAIHDMMLRNPSRVLILEEAQDLLVHMTATSQGSHKSEMAEYLKKTFTASKGVLPAREAAGSLAPPPPVVRPHLSVWLTGIRGPLWEKLDKSMTYDGFLSRLLYFEMGIAADRFEGDEGELMKKILMRCKAYKDIAAGETPLVVSPGLTEVVCPLRVKRSPAAYLLLNEYQEKANQECLVFEQDGAWAEGALWSRAHENVCKVSLLAAGSRCPPDRLIVEPQDVKLAIAVVESCIELTMRRLSERVDSIMSKRINESLLRVTKWMQLRKRKSGKVKFAPREVMRNVHMHKREFDEAVINGHAMGVLTSDAKFSIDQNFIVVPPTWVGIA